MTPKQLKKVIRKTKSIKGWFSTGAAHLFILLDYIQKKHGITGNLFEIGVHHGKSAILLGAMTSQSAEVLGVCDLFAEQTLNVSGSGKADKEIFMANFLSIFPDTSFLRIFEKSSAALTIQDVTDNCRFFHIDGGHSASEAFCDLALAAASISPQGIVALDDAFNPAWPGVTEALFEFLRLHPDKLRPLAIGFNKIVLTPPAARALYLQEIDDSKVCWSFIPAEPYDLKKLEFCGSSVCIFHVPTGKREDSMRSRLYQWYFQNPLLRNQLVGGAIKTLKPGRGKKLSR